jgi:hypothetical protein
VKLAEQSEDLDATISAAYAAHAAFEQIAGVEAARAASESNLRFFCRPRAVSTRAQRLLGARWHAQVGGSWHCTKSCQR